FIGDKKYACATCIKGHRSSSCAHTDRPLIEVKKKGRPVTQCEHCRDLRKTKQVHIKCVCVSRPDKQDDTGEENPRRKKGASDLPYSPATLV
ncbi:copper-fist-domain-containing protein, partial [Auricularia subglabra TFB-10046 SS5]